MMSRTSTVRVVPIVSLAVSLMIGLAPGAAAAQEEFQELDAASVEEELQVCSSGGNVVAGPGLQIKARGFIQGSCSNQEIAARSWFDGWTAVVRCVSGAYVGSGKCQQTFRGEGEAIAHAEMIIGCGQWDAKAEVFARTVPTNQVWWFRSIGPVAVTGRPCIRADDDCEEWELWDNATQRCIPYNSPILVPLTRSQDYHLTSVDDGVMFDMDDDGVPERTAWTARNSRLAILAIDVDDDGRITSGRELVGDRMVEGRHNGFSALAALAPPDTAKLTDEHELFHRLLLWEDRNHDGVSQPNELQAAGNVISEIGLGYVPHNRRDQHGNQFMYQGWASVRTGPGPNPTTSHTAMLERNIKLYDVFFKEQQ